MTGNDMPPPAFRPQFNDLRVALALLTRLPLPHPAFDADDPRPAAHAAWAYPVAGFVVAMLAVVGGAVALALGLPPTAAALIVLAIGAASTGAMHEDGLADCADGFWGGWTRERRLEIMKDSQIGTYGVIALILSFGLRWSALSGLMATGAFFAPVVTAAVASRAGMVMLMHALPHARTDGLSRQTGTVPRQAALIAGGIGLLTALFLTAATLLPMIIALLFAGFATALIAKAKIGGQTGDVLGATQQIFEITVLLVCLATLP